ncbi:MAG: hypothetical protein J1E06_08975 [Acutalibacter sp.]|nr:hypothetical protein [Acutalibacter sp.]
MDTVRNRLQGFWGGAAWVSAFLFLCVMGALLSFPRAVQSSVKNSILYCLTVLVPSLFPFLALTGFAVHSGASEVLGNRLGFLSRYVFRLPSVCAVPIFMSFIGGYPAGAKAASLLLEQEKIDEEQAGRMMLFCVNPGIAFVVTFLGGAVLGSFRTGWFLFLAVTISGVVLGVFAGLFHPVPPKEAPSPAKTQGNALIRSAMDASSSVVKMCVCIVLFSGLSALLHSTGIFQLFSRLAAATKLVTPVEAAGLVSFLLEVTEGVGAASALRVGPQFFAFGLAFGGLCVHLQIFSLFPVFPAKKRKFYLFRFLHGGLAFGCYLLIEKLLPGGATAAFSSAVGVQQVTVLSGTLAGGLSLLLMCMAFLLVVSKDEKKE